MKANEAPERIYVSNYSSGLTYNWHNEQLAVNDIEYIRKDTFIEKASRWIEENICEYCEGENIIFTADNTQYIDILNQQQFIEDFKNYMKGE